MFFVVDKITKRGSRGVTFHKRVLKLDRVNDKHDFCRGKSCKVHNLHIVLCFPRYTRTVIQGAWKPASSRRTGSNDHAVCWLFWACFVPFFLIFYYGYQIGCIWKDWAGVREECATTSGQYQTFLGVLDTRSVSNQQHFRAFFRASPLTCERLWTLLDPKETMPKGVQPFHLLWGLVFMKVYATEAVHCKIINSPDKKHSGNGLCSL